MTDPLAPVRQVVTGLAVHDVIGLIDSPVQHLLAHEIEAVGADEGSIWWADAPRTSLHIVANTGPFRDTLVGRFAQPLARGLISMVFAMQQPFCETDVTRNSRQDSTLDRTLGVRTDAMIAVPLHVGGDAVGVVSCVQLGREGRDRDGRATFDPAAIRRMQDLSVLLGRLIDWALMTRSSHEG